MQFLFFCLGSCIGSYYLCVLDNFPHFLIHKRSCCPYCHEQLKPYHLIPIISFMFLKGRCSFCNHRISWRYPLFEASCGAIFIVCFNLFNFFEAINILILLAISISDIIHGIIYDSLLITLFMLIICTKKIFLGPSLVILSIGIFLSLAKLIGFGDIKLLAIYGLIFDYQKLIWVLFLASFLAIFLTKKREIRFAPFLSIAIISILVI